jgi:hypothetical protein
MGDVKHSIKDVGNHMEYSLNCPICANPLCISIQKTIISKDTRFPFEFVDIHGNPPHGLTFYIDKNWAIRGVEYLKNVVVQGENVSIYSKITPKKKAKISPMAPQLGIVSKKEYEILMQIDGKRNIEDLAAILKQNPDELMATMQQFQQKGLIHLESKS